MKVFKWFDWSRKPSAVQGSLGDIVFVDTHMTNNYVTPANIAESLTIKTGGRPVQISFQSRSGFGSNLNDSLGCLVLWNASARSSTFSDFFFDIYRNGNLISRTGLGVGGASGRQYLVVPPGCLNFIDMNAPAGSHTYTFAVRGSNDLANEVVKFRYVRILAYEL